MNEQGEAVGEISTTKYYFGNYDVEFKEHAFSFDSPLIQDRGHGIHEIPAVAILDDYKNVFALYHSIGSVSVRSAEGGVRDGAFNGFGSYARSSYSVDGYGGCRYFSMGFRLVEVRAP